MEPALDDRDRPTLEAAEKQAPDVAGGGCRRPAGQLGERDGNRAFQLVGEAAQARAEDHADLGPEIRSTPNGGIELTKALGEVGRGYLCDGSGHRTSSRARATSETRPGGRRQRGPRLLAPDGSIDTGMPITSRRDSLPAGGP